MGLPFYMLISEFILYYSTPFHRIENLINYIFGIGIHNAATKVFGNFASLQQLKVT